MLVKKEIVGDFLFSSFFEGYAYSRGNEKQNKQTSIKITVFSRSFLIASEPNLNILKIGAIAVFGKLSFSNFNCW